MHPQPQFILCIYWDFHSTTWTSCRKKRSAIKSLVEVPMNSDNFHIVLWGIFISNNKGFDSVWVPLGMRNSWQEMAYHAGKETAFSTTYRHTTAKRFKIRCLITCRLNHKTALQITLTFFIWIIASFFFFFFFWFAMTKSNFWMQPHTQM